ncbi:M23 family metallopeptidase [Candidatus Peribacteria bacterium]|nr:M23 family metallopeptidase [Candidatus Peribacteria bacterium]
MEIRIHLPRPFLTITIAVAVLLYATGIVTVQWPGSELRDDALGGEHPASVVTDARRDIDREKVTQAVLEKREEILRYNLSILERAALETKSPEDIKKLNDARAVLLSIIKERSQSEKLLLLSLEQLWEAQGTAYRTEGVIGDRVLLWPVPPTLGLSATFEDQEYEKLFGFKHHAIDIPVEQGTEVKAPAGGTVSKISMNGLGYSYIVLEHEGGMQTVYGHMTDATVLQGATVKAGEVIGHTGGQPGTLGAGLTTTGPHLHFAVRKDGVLVDPMKYLPTIRQ